MFDKKTLGVLNSVGFYTPRTKSNKKNGIFY